MMIRLMIAGLRYGGKMEYSVSSNAKWTLVKIEPMVTYRTDQI
jgi:hypothetical protein